MRAYRCLGLRSAVAAGFFAFAVAGFLAFALTIAASFLAFADFPLAPAFGFERFTAAADVRFIATRGFAFFAGFALAVGCGLRAGLGCLASRSDPRSACRASYFCLTNSQISNWKDPYRGFPALSGNSRANLRRLLWKRVLKK